MDAPTRDDCLEAVRQFGKEHVSVEPLRGGHINHSFKVTSKDESESYVLQRINPYVFPNSAGLIENSWRINRHLASRHGLEPPYRLQLIPTSGGGKSWLDPAGSHWRLTRFVDGAVTYLEVERAEQAYEVGRTFGAFETLLSDLDAPPLEETIPRFHDTPHRYAQLIEATRNAVPGRTIAARAEIEIALGHEALGARIERLLRTSVLPLRTVHNDCKISNILFDEDATPIVVIDLDTCMPGTVLYDFGDMVRSSSHRWAEDHPDAHEVEIDVELFSALAEGYLAGSSAFLTPDERNHLLDGGLVLVLEQGVRFLADYLLGDPYFRVDHPEQNLVRARTQFALLESMLRREEELRSVVG